MSGGEVNSFPIQVLFNYWEYCPTLGANASGSVKKTPLTDRLDELMCQGVTRLTSFIPWQALESDIAHTLARFLQAAGERKIEVSLIVTPELGVHYANSGIPKDTLRAAAEMAEHCDKAPVVATLPPNMFAVPSFFNPDFGKRYYGFLQRVDGLLGDLAKNHPESVRRVQLIVTGSFWKYYRSPLRSTRMAFNGPAGDFSGAASVIFRQRVEQYYSQREFQDPTPMAANRWKARAMDDINRRWFYQQSEEVFKHRTFQMLGKRAQSIPVRELELYTPEADPGFAYAHLLQTLSGGHADLSRLSALVDEAASRLTYGSASPASPFIHWSGLGGFQSLADSQKQFLILKSLLLMGGLGGGVLLDERDWFALSQAFRTRAEGIARQIQYGKIGVSSRVAYLAPHCWSGAELLWEELFNQIGSEARSVASPEALLGLREAQMVVVDPSVIFTRGMLERLIRWAESGRVVAIPRSTLFTESARLELERVASGSRKMAVNFNIPYQLHLVGSGKLVVFEWNPSRTLGESRAYWAQFLSVLLSIAEIEVPCQMSDSRARALPLKGGSVFVLNESTRELSAELIFKKPVAVSDFSHVFGGTKPADVEAPSVASRFELDLAPCGVIALAVDWMEPRQESAVEPKAPEMPTMNVAHTALPEFTGLGGDSEAADRVDASSVLQSAMGLTEPGFEEFPGG